MVAHHEIRPLTTDAGLGSSCSYIIEQAGHYDNFTLKTLVDIQCVCLFGSIFKLDNWELEVSISD